MTDNTSELIEIILENYLNVRDGQYPFPPDSVAAFALICAIQAKNKITGDMCEVGVEHGGTAFLLMQSLSPKDNLQLIDMIQTERFSKTFNNLSESLKRKVDFRVASSFSPNLEDITSKKYRIMHIDAGHSKEDVLKDLNRFADLLDKKGVCALDDIFEIRWPGVTEAVIEYLKTSEIAPFFIADRKLYCCLKKDHSFWLGEVNKYVKLLESYGKLRHWVEPWSGYDTLILKMNIKSDFFSRF